MTRRSPLGASACAAVMCLAALSGAERLLGQQQVRLEATTAAPASADSTVADADVLSSVEEGRTPLYMSFDWRPWRLQKRRDALRDTKFEFNLRTFYFDRHQFSGAESQAWAIGGWAGLKTGYFLDHLAFGVTGYTSQRLYGPEDRDGTRLLKPQQKSYGVLGELYADVRIYDGLNLFAGRKGYDTPFINRYDVRMTPNTFEAIALMGHVELDQGSADPGKDGADPAPANGGAVIKYGAGYFNRIKEQNSDNFVSMSVAAGATVKRGVYTGGAVYEKGGFSIGAIDYYSPDIINIGYAEAKLEVPLDPGWKPKFYAQFVDQRSVGDNLLQGRSFSTHQFGLQAELPVGKALFTLAFTHAWGNADLRSPWSGYPGYTSVQVQDFNRAGESAVLLRAGYDFPWLEGLGAYALAVFGTTPSQAGQYRQNEYDFNLQWAPPKGVLKGLSVRVRYAVVHQYGGNVDNLTDFRAICNYVIKF